jgi:hypothetical protein
MKRIDSVFESIRFLRTRCPKKTHLTYIEIRKYVIIKKEEGANWWLAPSENICELFGLVIAFAIGEFSL